MRLVNVAIAAFNHKDQKREGSPKNDARGSHRELLGLFAKAVKLSILRFKQGRSPT
jgi:hypothetical protein